MLLLPIALFTSFVFGINNSGLSTGSLLASGFSYRKGIALTGIGFVAGAMLEGSKMSGTLAGLTGTQVATLSVLFTNIDNYWHIILHILISGHANKPR